MQGGHTLWGKKKNKMSILVLSRKPSLYSTRRLVEAAQKRGHDVRVIDYLRCYMNITSRKPTVIYKGEKLTSYDAIIPRIGASYTFYGAAVVRQFEMGGIFSVNESQAISRSRDKLRSLQILAREGIGMPVTGFANHSDDIDGMIETMKGTPLVMKLLEGTQGKGVVLAETKKAAGSVLSAFRQLKANILVQEFIKEADGKDIRAFVVGDKVVGSMEREAPDGEFRANLHLGAEAKKIELSEKEKKMAVDATKTLGLSVAGVDMIRSNEGLLVIEVNSSPGLEGIEKTTDEDIASEVIKYIEKTLDDN